MPAVASPIVRPVSVTVTADAGMAAPAVVMMMYVAAVALHVPVSPATLLLPAATVGVMDGAKKAGGYVSVMVPPEGSSVEDVKLSVSGTADFATIRSCKLTTKDRDSSCPRMLPLDTAAEGTVSADVSTVTATAPGVTAPIVNPAIVTVKAAVAIAAPAVVIMKEVAVVAPHVTVKPGVLLPPTTTVGVMDAAKNAAG